MITTQHRSPEGRVLDNFLATCTTHQFHNAITQTWLNDIVPGLKHLVGCDQGRLNHFEGDCARHTTLVFEKMREVCLARFGRAPDSIENVSVLLHDLCKPATREELTDGEVIFPGHEAKAAEAVPGIASMLGLSPIETERLVFLVARHGDAHDFPKLTTEQKIELTSSPWIESLALLQEADALACILKDGSNLPVRWDELVGYKGPE